MATVADFYEALNHYVADAAKLRLIVQGDETTVVDTMFGPIDSVAKTIAEIEAEINAAGTGWLALAEAAADESEQAKNDAIAAAMASGIDAFANTYADAQTAAGSLQVGDSIMIFTDENASDSLTVRLVESGPTLSEVKANFTEASPLLSSTAPGEGASLVTYQNGLTVQQAFPLVQRRSLLDVANDTFLTAIPGRLQVRVESVVSDFVLGGGDWTYDPNKPRSEANFVTIFDPTTLNGWDGTADNLRLTIYAAGGQGSGTGNGCWVRQLEGVITSAMAGAVPDGVTDALAPMSAAIDVWGADRTDDKGVLRIVGGKYHLSGALEMKAGAGSGVGNNRVHHSRIEGYGAVFDNEIRSNALGLSVAGITIDGAPGDGWTFQFSQGSSYTDCAAIRCGGHGWAFDDSTVGLASGRFHNCIAHTNTGDGFYIDYAGAQFVNDMSFIGCESRFNNWGFNVTGNSTGISLTDCLTEGNGSGAINNANSRAFSVVGGYIVGGINDLPGNITWFGTHTKDVPENAKFAMVWAQNDPGFQYIINGRHEKTLPSIPPGEVKRRMNGTGPHTARYSFQNILGANQDVAVIHVHLIGRRSDPAAEQYFVLHHTLTYAFASGSYQRGRDAAISAIGCTVTNVGSQYDYAVSGGAGTFQANETVTGGTSGNTAQFYEEAGGVLSGYALAGVFSVGETITGSVSGATRTVDSGGTQPGYITIEYNTDDTQPIGPFDKSTYETFL